MPIQKLGNDLFFALQRYNFFSIINYELQNPHAAG
jgi:hypothetical protein